MIPATHPYRVTLRHEHTGADGKTHYAFSRVPIIAWSDDGAPLVVGSTSLRRGDEIPGFWGIERADDHYITAIPGGGWRIRWFVDEDESFVEPVLCWAVTQEGIARPVTTDRYGSVAVVDDTEQAFHLIRPDENDEES